MLWVRISIRARCTTLCDKVCQWLATGWWLCPGTSVSSTNKTDLHDLAEILLKVALDTIKQTSNKTTIYKPIPNDAFSHVIQCWYNCPGIIIIIDWKHFTIIDDCTVYSFCVVLTGKLCSKGCFFQTFVNLLLKLCSWFILKLDLKILIFSLYFSLRYTWINWYVILI
jgi:hypothetical protein